MLLAIVAVFTSVHSISALQNAAEPTVNAELSDAQTRINDAVTLTITVKNARVARPPAVAADGLSINFVGT
jgi:hypothetical protein